MNDEELRAFLNSARPAKGAAPEDGAAPADAEATPEGAASRGEAEPQATQPGRGAEASKGPAEGGLRVPSFDELMGFGAPESASPPSNAAQPSEPSSSPAPRPALITDPAPASPTEPAATALSDEPDDDSDELTLESLFDVSDETTSTHLDNGDDEELVPLVLPGFSPEPPRAEPLPPVFSPEPSVPAAPTAPPSSSATPNTVHADPAPTQPFELEPETPATNPAPPVASTSRASSPAAPVSGVPDSVPAAPTRPSVPVVPVAATSRRAPASSTESDPDVLAALGLAGSEASAATPDSRGGDDEYEPIAVTGGRSGGRKALPWIIVAGGAIIAIVASVLVINGVRGSDTDPIPTPAPAPTTTQAPVETEDPEPSETEAPEPEVPTDEVPVVEVGPTWTLSIPQWNLDVEMSNRYGGRTPYVLTDGGTKAMFTLPLAESLPDSCAAAREPNVWGLLRKEDGTLEAIRPEPRCTDPDAAAVYDTLWGLMDATAKSARPM